MRKNWQLYDTIMSIPSINDPIKIDQKICSGRVFYGSAL